MAHILHVSSSGRGHASVSRQAAEIVLNAKDHTSITHRDLRDPVLPILTQEWIEARLTPPESLTAEDKRALATSDALIAELDAADIILISMPMYNFGMPASLKLWVDLICRPKRTFKYLPDGPVGLLQGKSAIIVAASGGVPIDSPVDLATPHLRQVLNFIGITDIETRVAKDVLAQANS